METLANLDSFARTAEGGSFSEAGRRLGLTAAETWQCSNATWECGCFTDQPGKSRSRKSASGSWFRSTATLMRSRPPLPRRQHTTASRRCLESQLESNVWSHAYPALAAALPSKVPANQAGVAFREPARGPDRRELRCRDRGCLRSRPRSRIAHSGPGACPRRGLTSLYVDPGATGRPCGNSLHFTALRCARRTRDECATGCSGM